LIDLLQQSLIRWLEVSEFLRDAILGLLILFAVASDKVILGRLRTLGARARQRSQDQGPPLDEAARGA
jgi:rhamnose transport system permease protein